VSKLHAGGQPIRQKMHWKNSNSVSETILRRDDFTLRQNRSWSVIREKALLLRKDGTLYRLDQPNLPKEERSANAYE
jgi:hypothetical protein